MLLSLLHLDVLLVDFSGLQLGDQKSGEVNFIDVSLAS